MRAACQERAGGSSLVSSGVVSHRRSAGSCTDKFITAFFYWSLYPWYRWAWEQSHINDGKLSPAWILLPISPTSRCFAVNLSVFNYFLMTPLSDCTLKWKKWNGSWRWLFSFLGGGFETSNSKEIPKIRFVWSLTVLMHVPFTCCHTLVFICILMKLHWRMASASERPFVFSLNLEFVYKKRQWKGNEWIKISTIST